MLLSVIVWAICKLDSLLLSVDMSSANRENSFNNASKSIDSLRFYSVDQFTRSCVLNLSYIGMSTQHLGTRAGEHMNLDESHKSTIKDHLWSCHQC